MRGTGGRFAQRSPQAAGCQERVRNAPTRGRGAGADARQLWQTLAAIDKSDLAQEVYVRHVCVTLQDVYQQAASNEGTPVATWIAQWHEGMLRVVEVEQDWFARRSCQSSRLRCFCRCARAPRAARRIVRAILQRFCAG